MLYRFLRALQQNRAQSRLLHLLSALKLINNLSSLNKGNHDRDGVWILISIDFFFLVFFLVLVSIV